MPTTLPYRFRRRTRSRPRDRPRDRPHDRPHDRSLDRTRLHDRPPCGLQLSGHTLSGQLVRLEASQGGPWGVLGIPRRYPGCLWSCLGIPGVPRVVLGVPGASPGEPRAILWRFKLQKRGICMMFWRFQFFRCFFERLGRNFSIRQRKNIVTFVSDFRRRNC